MKKLSIACAAGILCSAAPAVAQSFPNINISVTPQIAVLHQTAIAMNVNASPATAVAIGVLGGQAVAIASTSASQNATVVNLGVLTQNLITSQQ